MQVDRGSVTSICTLSGIVNFGDLNWRPSFGDHYHESIDMEILLR